MLLLAEMACLTAKQRYRDLIHFIYMNAREQTRLKKKHTHTPDSKNKHCMALLCKHLIVCSKKQFAK